MMLLLFGGAFEGSVEEAIAGAGGKLVHKPRKLKTEQARPIVTEDAKRLQTEKADG